MLPSLLGGGGGGVSPLNQFLDKEGAARCMDSSCTRLCEILIATMLSQFKFI